MATRKNSHPEWDLQAVCNSFLAAALPIGSYWNFIDSGMAAPEYVKIARAKRGIKSGNLDGEVLCLGFPPIKFELKVPGGVVSPDQETTMTVWRRNGGGAFVAYSLDELEAGLRAYGIPLRATAGGRWEAALAAMEARAAKPKRPRTRRSYGAKAPTAAQRRVAAIRNRAP